jgi:tRNA threonylcarbamoyladenosine biosynthesis protein TsaB
MLILACDTATETASVALWQDDRLLGESFANRGLTHSETFMPLVEKMLQENKLTAGDISHFAATTGPGSFTGVRIGLSAVKAMAYAVQKPVLGFSTLAVMAWPYQILPDTLVCPMLDARNNRAYTTAFLKGREVIAPANRLVNDFLQEAGQLAGTDQGIRTVLFVGMEPDQNSLASGSLAKKAILAPRACSHPRAGWLAEMAARAAARGEGMPAADLKAEYLALTSAQRQRQTNAK